MNDHMDDFLTRCLDSVPYGTYRDRVERELRDHLLALVRDLEGAGHAPEEARALAQERMGDPAELSRRYAQEWRRRTLGQRALVTAEVFLVGTVMVVMSCLYAINTHNFGKSLPGYWGFVAIPATVALLCGSLTGSWTLARWSSLVIITIQLPPIFCWLVCASSFEMSGMMVPFWLGAGLHLLFFAWGMINYLLADRSQQEKDILSKAQSE